jgi:hypothetical protein
MHEKRPPVGAASHDGIAITGWADDDGIFLGKNGERRKTG